MRASKIIHTVSCHAEGEVGDVIVGGVAPPPGDSIWEQSRFIARDETLRNFMGGVSAERRLPGGVTSRVEYQGIWCRGQQQRGCGPHPVAVGASRDLLAGIVGTHARQLWL